MKKKTKIGITVGALAVVSGILIFQSVGAKPPAQPVDTVSLVRMDLSRTVSTTGMVESVNGQGVYSNLAYQIQTVNVKVGDVVAPGDLLCQLDTATIALNIKQQKAALGAQQSAGGQQITVASHNLENLRVTNDEALNSSIIQAQMSVDQASYNVDTAKATLDTAERKRDAVVIETGSSTPQGLSGGAIIPGVITSNNTAALTNTQDLDDGVRKAKIAYDAAVNSLNNARTALRATLRSADVQESQLEDALKTARVASNTSAQQVGIEVLEKNLADTSVKAPVGGTVTAVYAKEGAVGSGLLFMVEDITHLQVSTSVKEYDVLSVTPGTKVLIKADATGEDQYEGVISSVAPTATKSQTGVTAVKANSEFAVEVEVTSPETRLLVGMNARLDIIVEEKKDVLALPTEAIATGATGEDVVFVADKQADGTYLAKEVQVKVGMESDYYLELDAPDITMEDLIILNVDMVTAGAPVSLDKPAAAESATSSSADSAQSAAAVPEQTPPANEAKSSAPAEEDIPSGDGASN